MMHSSDLLRRDLAQHWSVWETNHELEFDPFFIREYPWVIKYELECSIAEFQFPSSMLLSTKRWLQIKLMPSM